MSNVIQMPGIGTTPDMLLADALSRAMAGEIDGVCCMFTGADGVMKIAWTGFDARDLAAYAVSLTTIASSRISDGE